MRNYFTLNGVDSRDFGVYISGQGTFSAPARDYNVLSVPGRNGDLVGPEKRFQNGTLTYPAFIYTNFNQNIKDFRNFLLSLFGYHDLVDSYHPDEIRKVIYQGPFDPTVVSKNDAGKFDITFNCKPQRFLASGNEVTTFDSAGETETFSGSVVTFDNPGNAIVNALSTAINPVQDLHGYDSPWPAGGGKNLIDLDITKTAGASLNHYSPAIQVQPGDYYVYCCNESSSNFNSFVQISEDGSTFSNIGTDTTVQTAFADQTMEFGKRKSKVTVVTALYIRIRLNASSSLSGAFKGVVTKDSTGYSSFPNKCLISDDAFQAVWSPYSNVCPISGFSAANIVVSPTQDAQDGTTYTVQFGTTAYAGTLDVISGVLKKRPSYASYNGEALVGPWISSMDAYAVGTTPTTGAQVVDLGGAETTVTLTPTEIALLTGTNNIWSDTGDVTATIVFPQDHFTITNPTLFDSQPLLRVYGTGTLGIGSQSITITQADSYTDIDCEMMDCFKGAVSKNRYVELSGHNFPVLKPGVNNISLTGITKVQITPRWWVL